MANAGLIASALSEMGLMEKSRPEFTGINKKGCLAVVLANKDYCGIDRGDTVFYCSTEGRLVRGGVGDTKELSEPSKGAILLPKTLTKIRVICSSTLPKANKYQPAEGLQYDSLYAIKSHVILEQKGRYTGQTCLSPRTRSNPLRGRNDQTI